MKRVELLVKISWKDFGGGDTVFFSVVDLPSFFLYRLEEYRLFNKKAAQTEKGVWFDDRRMNSFFSGSIVCRRFLSSQRSDRNQRREK